MQQYQMLTTVQGNKYSPTQLVRVSIGITTLVDNLSVSIKIGNVYTHEPVIPPVSTLEEACTCAQKACTRMFHFGKKEKDCDNEICMH